MTTLLILLVLLAFISGAELFGVMLAAAALGALTSARSFLVEFDGLIVSVFGGLTDDKAATLSTIPMFIYAGYVLAEAKTADRLVRFANALMGWMPGGLAIVTIGTCALFTTFTGASGVTIVALGGVLMPALVKSGYPKRFSMGMLAGTGSVGLLFPPALPLFVYGTVYGIQLVGDPEAAANWDNRRFLVAGILPGIVTVVALSLVAVFVARKLPRQKFELGELGRSFLAALPELLIPFGVIGLLVTGFGSLPEIASLTVMYVILLEVVALRMVKPRILWNVSREAMAMVGAIFIIIVASTAFTNYLVTNDVPNKLVEWTKQYVDSKMVFLLALNVLLLVVGMIMDIFSAIVIVLPLITPIARFYGVDPYHLGVIFLLNLEVGYLTPPVGLNLFITSIKFQTPVIEVMRATLPFIVTLLVALMIVTYVPALTEISVQIQPAERRSPISTLHAMVAAGAEESKVAVPTLELVDATGAVLKDDTGQPIVRRFLDCNALEGDTARTVCQNLFFDVTACTAAPGVPEAQARECRTKAIASWVASNLNEDPSDNEKAVIVIKEIGLVDSEGAPLMKGEAPVVRRYEQCASKTGTDRETCRALFATASACFIRDHDVATCIAEAAPTCAPAGGEAPASDAEADAGSAAAGSAAAGSAAAGSAAAGSADAGSAAAGSAAAGSAAAGSAAPAGPDCVAVARECRQAAITACVKEKAAEWVEEFPDAAAE